MPDDTLDTLTTIEAKALCERFGIENIDELPNAKALSIDSSQTSGYETQTAQIAKKPDHENSTAVLVSERSTLRKPSLKP